MEVSRARVDVRSWLNGGHDIDGVTGKIVTLIGDVRVGRVTLSNNNNEQGIVEDHRTYQVTVPVGRVLHLEVDREIIDSNNQRVKHLELFRFANGILSNNHEVDNHEVNANITWINNQGENIQGNGEQHFITHPEQPQRPVEIKMVSGHLTVVYTIGDEISFTEFIMTLRRLLADHREREDIMDHHDFLNLSATREHPLLPKPSPEAPPAKWIHIKLQVVEPDRGTRWTTLLMRDVNLYVHGFINQQGHVFELLERRGNYVNMIPAEYAPQRLELDVSYRSLLGALDRPDVIRKLGAANLGRDFAVKAVQVLSSYPDPVQDMSVGEALAGLIFLTCESARMNPVHDSFAAGGWSRGDGFTGEDMMSRYVWRWGDMSRLLQSWKRRSYAEPQHVSEVQATYLVLYDRRQAAGDPAGTKTSKPSSGGGDDSGNQSNKDSGGPSSSRPGGSGGQGDDPMAPRRRRSQDKDSGKSPVNDDKVQGHGRPRPRVELLTLAMHPDFLVDGVKVVVFDGKRGQIIYRKDEQEQRQEEKGQGGQQEMVDLVLTGPYRGISAEYGCFAIKFDSNKHPPSKWEWDCDHPDHAAQVDAMQPAQGTITTSDGQKVAEVTYVVMSDALEATVQVRLRLQDDGRSRGGIYTGEISARIDGCEHKSVLFRPAGGKGQRFSTTNDDPWFLLELARNVVAVPRGSALHIVLSLHVLTDDAEEVVLQVSACLDNVITCCSKTDDDGNEVQVQVTWYPEITRPDETRETISQPQLSLTAEDKLVPGHPTVVYTIGDELSFTEFIMNLRGILADHPDREDILDRHHSSILSSTGEHPVLPKQRAEQPARWIHIKLQAVKGEEMFSTTLLMRDDNLYVCGFINQQGVVYELIENADRSADILPVDEYNPQRLSWGVDYRSLLDADTEDDLLKRLAWMEMGHDFAMDAVCVLSGFPGWVDGKKNPRVFLAGLMFMVCESARMNPVNTFFAIQWNNKELQSTRFGHNELRDYLFNYMSTSRQLLMWKSKGYDNPCPMSQLLNTYLVLNCHLNPPQDSSMGRGRPRVELLAMRADLGVDGTTVTVFDGKRGHIIYMKEEQEEKETMVDLVLTGPYTSISASGCFAIKIDIPPAGTATGSSKGDAGSSIKWEWDCYDPEYTKEVDKGPKTRTISSPDPGRNVEVTYVVMSNALEATVQVNLRMRDGNNPCSVHGLITARIGDFKDQIIFFRRTEETAQHFSPVTDSPQVVLYQLVRSLKLARNVVAVPCGQMLHIEMHLNIVTSENQEVSKRTRFDDILSFGNGSRSKRRQVDDLIEAEVNVVWYPDSSSDSSERSLTLTKEIKKYATLMIKKESQRQPDISYKVGEDAQGFSTFITELRRLVAENPRCKDLMAHHPQVSSTHNHTVLPKVRSILATGPIESERLFHIKLEVVEGVETSSITLVMRDDNLDVLGFINKNGDCYQPEDEKIKLPSSEYGPKSLPWRQADDIFLEEATKVGMTFGADAVRLLSRYEEGALREYRQALVVLKVMVSDSARIEPVRQAIAGGWDNGMGLTPELKVYTNNWPVISRALLDWRDHAYHTWPQNGKLEKIGILSPEDALKVVPLIFNDKERICRVVDLA